MDYRTRIAKGLYWVPARILGECHYSKSEIELISRMSLQEMTGKIKNLSEAIEIFVASKYRCKNITYTVINNGLEWECHPSIENFFQGKAGDCASAAAWLTTVLSECYDSIEQLLIFRDNDSGHVINVIKHNSSFYFVDMYLHLVEYQKCICPESGKLIDFAKQTYITSVVYESDKIETFVDFYSKVMKNHVKEHIFFVLKAEMMPPIASKKNDGELLVYIPKSFVSEVYNKSNHMKWIGDIELDI